MKKSRRRFASISAFVFAFAAVGATAFQLAVYCAVSTPTHPVRGFCQTFLWDSNWYGSIVDHGYESVGQNIWYANNAAFFPAFPALVRAATVVFPFSTELMLPLTALLCAVGFWTYVLLYLRRSGVSSTVRVLLIAFIITHPLGFILSVGYSEPMFLMLTMGFLYWMRFGKGRSGTALAALHGVVLTATRLPGAVIAGFPAIAALFTKKTGPARIANGVALTAVALSGVAAYFLYLRWHFGVWDMFFRAQQAGWNTTTDFLRFLDVRLYFPQNATFALRDLNRLSIPVTAVAIVLIASIDRGCSTWKRMRERVAYYACAAGLLYLTMIGHMHTADGRELFIATTRYLFPAHVLLALAVVQFVTENKREPTRLEFILLLCAFLASFSVELAVIRLTGNIAP